MKFTRRHLIKGGCAGLAGALVLVAAAGMPPFQDILKEKRIRWQAKADPVYIEPDDDFVKDPSVLQAEGRYYMFYTAAAPGFQGGRPPWRIDYATSPDGLRWTKQGTAFAANAGTWEAGRVQAPSRPILFKGEYYMFYGGGPREPVNRVYTGFATSKDLVHWTKHPEVVEHGAKANDPFVMEDRGRFYLFYTTYDEHEPIFYRTSTDLRTWSDPVGTGADGEGTTVWKAEGGGYYLAACTGYSGRGEYYKLFYSQTLTGFRDLGRFDMDVPPFAADSFGHGDVLLRGGEAWLYFQGTRTGGRTFRIGLAISGPAPAFRATRPGNRP
jgi:hypothetical protein